MHFGSETFLKSLKRKVKSGIYLKTISEFCQLRQEMGSDILAHFLALILLDGVQDSNTNCTGKGISAIGVKMIGLLQ